MAIHPDDARFADAIVTRQLWALPPLLAVPNTDDVVRALECSVTAKQPPPALLLRTLRKTLSMAARDNDAAIPRVAPFLHQLATELPENSKAGDVAAGLLLLFAHGLGQVVIPSSTEVATTSDIAVRNKTLIVFLGFAGGTPATLRQYASRTYPDSDFDVVIVPASEIPEIYNTSIDQVVKSIEGPRPAWVIHLFSKAGFLLCARLMARFSELNADEDAATLLPPPKAVIWDSSPGSVTNYEEFCEGTWASVELIAKKSKLQLSDGAKSRLRRILRSEAYPEAVRDSYAPMHSLVPFPVDDTEHLFLFSDKDPVCDPQEIRKYAQESVTKQKQVVVSGAHCDGLFWSAKLYLEAVRSVVS
jgi:hypothetical protein